MSNKKFPFSKLFVLHCLMYCGCTTGTYYYNATLTTIASTMDGNVILAGMLASTYSLVAMFCRPVAGFMNEKFGRRRSNEWGLYGTILSILLMIIAKDLMVLFIARVLAGISFSVTSAANYAAASDLAPEDNKALGIGWFQNMATFASYIGPAVGVWGLNRYLATGSWSAFYVVTLLTAVYSLVLNFFIRYENKPEWKAKMAAAAEARKNKQAVLEDGPVLPPMKPFLGMTVPAWLLIISLALVAMAQQSVGSFLLLSGKERGITALGSYFLLQTIGMFICKGFIAPKIEKIGAMKVVSFAVAVAIVSYFVFSIATSVVPLLIIAPFYGCVWGTFPPVCNTLIVASVPQDRKGFASAMYLFGIDVGYGIGPTLWGIVIAAVGYAKVYFVALFLPIIAMVLFVIYWKGWGKAIFEATQTWKREKAAKLAASAEG
ncbi:MAG: MFS transporter [Clostridiales bacterium]|uniref:MFS transporter n=1 Tax=Provencibacterium massiliense TaxID=1841868 RepID=UPI0009A8B843|nr:MFS transporter [Provencibacterium massiliense]PWM37607.1 MAG: MFS transporter [Clostridiales bacterium]RGB69995.1 MFS transporter [Harryflintia acetispora]